MEEQHNPDHRQLPHHVCLFLLSFFKLLLRTCDHPLHHIDGLSCSQISYSRKWLLEIHSCLYGGDMANSLFVLEPVLKSTQKCRSNRTADFRTLYLNR